MFGFLNFIRITHKFVCVLIIFDIAMDPDPEKVKKLSNILHKLKDFVKCSICMDYIKEASRLSCCHVFCTLCIKQCRKQNQICPVCGKEIPRRSLFVQDLAVDKFSKFINMACMGIKDAFGTTAVKGHAHATVEPSVSKVACVEGEKDVTVKRGVSRHKKSKYNLNDETIQNKISDWIQSKDVATPFTPSDPVGENTEDFQMPSISQVELFDLKKKVFAQEEIIVPGANTDSKSSRILYWENNVARDTALKLLHDRSKTSSNTDSLMRPEVRANIEDPSRSPSLDEVFPKTPDIDEIDKRMHAIFEEECVENFQKLIEENRLKATVTSGTKKRPVSIKTHRKRNKSGSSSTWARLKHDDKEIEKACSEKKRTKAIVKRHIKKNGHNLEDISIEASAINEGANENKENQLEIATNHETINSEGDLPFAASTLRTSVTEENRNLFIVPPCPDDCEDALTIKQELRKWIEASRSDAKSLISRDYSTGSKVYNCFTNLLTYIDKLEVDKPTTSHWGQFELKEVAVQTSQKYNEKSDRISSDKSIRAYITESVSFNLTPVETRQNDLLSSSTNTTRSIDLNIPLKKNVINVDSSKNSNDPPTSDPSDTPSDLLHIHSSKEPCSGDTVLMMSLEPSNKTMVEKALQKSVVNVGSSKSSNDPPSYPLGLASDSSHIHSKEPCSGDSVLMVSLEPSNKTMVEKAVQKSVVNVDSLKHSNDPSSYPLGLASDSLHIHSKEPCSGDSVLMVSLKPSNRTVKEAVQKRSSQTCQFKRIRKPATDSDSDEDLPSKKKFLREDLSVEFIDSENSHTQNKNASDIEDPDQYLQDFMQKYDPEKQDKTKNLNNQSTLQNSTATDLSQHTTVIEMTGKGNKRSRPNPRDSPTFTEQLVANLDKIDLEIEQFERKNQRKRQKFTESNSFNSELDIVENTPAVKKCKSLDSKTKPSFENRPLQILRKGPTQSANCELLDSLTMSNLSTNKEATANTTLTRKSIDEMEDARDMLNELRNNEDFFINHFDPEENRCITDKTTLSESINNVQTQLKPVPQSLDDPNSIAAKKQGESTRVNILKNVMVHTDDVAMSKKQSTDCIIDESDDDSEDLIESTPQKKKDTSRLLRTPSLKDLSVIKEELLVDDIILPPPACFGDDYFPPTPPNHTANTMDVGSLTPDGFTDFLVTPDDQPHPTFRATIDQSLPPRTLFPSQTSEQSKRRSENLFMFPGAKPSYASTPKSISYTPSPLVTPSRQCLRKPNLMTSTPQQKSILNYLSATPSISSSHSSSCQKSKPCLTWSRLSDSDIRVLTSLERKKLVTISKTFSDKVTHLVVRVDEGGAIGHQTAKLLLAIAAGIWVVSLAWAQDCLSQGMIVPEDIHEAVDKTGAAGPQLSRLTDPQERIFRNFRVYCAPPMIGLKMSELHDILRLSGAIVVANLNDLMVGDGRVNIIIAEDNTESSQNFNRINKFEEWAKKYKVVTVEVTWIAECLTRYHLTSFQNYLLGVDESILPTLGYPDHLIASAPLTLSLSQ